MQQRGVELFKGGLFLERGDYSIYIHGDLCLTFDITFEYFCLLFCCFLAFCSLGSNQISDEGASTVAATLQVNQSLQELK